MLVCSDCDPECNDGDDDEELYEKPLVMLVPADDIAPDFRPRCNSRLALCEAGKVEITAAETIR